jgi:hypothetical protein
MAAAAIPRALTLTRTMRRPAGPKISTDPGPNRLPCPPHPAEAAYVAT